MSQWGVEILEAVIRWPQSHPFAENAKGWATRPQASAGVSVLRLSTELTGRRGRGRRPGGRRFSF
jgi:hypothetical protein